MKGPRKLFLIVAGLVFLTGAAIYFAGPSVQRSIFYPKPHGLPPVVGATAQELLARLETFLATNAPTVLLELQPGLSGGEISALEAQGGFRLPEDLRAFYRWHNGMKSNSPFALVPGHYFLPLDNVAMELDRQRRELAGTSFGQRAAYAVFAGHRKTWMQIFDDGAGDGYFFDSKRTDAEGAFFNHFAEGSYYVWFPSFRNFLAGMVESYETGGFKMATDHQSLEEDTERTQKIWERFGRPSEGG